MSKKDYLAVAGAIKLARIAAITEEAQNAINYAAELIADVLKKDNGRFNRDKFYIACGIVINI